MIELSQKEIKNTGTHYTPKKLSDFVAKRMVQNYSKFDNVNLSILDPAIGDAQLVSSLTREIYIHEKITAQQVEVYGFDTNNDAVIKSIDRLKNENHSKLDIRNTDFLEFISKQNNTPLFHNETEFYFDFVIANPPYIRTQILGAEKAQYLAKSFDLNGRIDIYQAFIEAISRVLKPGGIVGLIVSNRFMSIQSGMNTRESIRKKFDILEVWDFGDTKIFEAAVLPVVLILRKKELHEKKKSKEPLMTTVYSTKDKPSEVKELFEAINTEGVYDIGLTDYYQVTKGTLNLESDKKSIWSITNKKIKKWLDTVQANTQVTFKDVGDVKVGVKTTADNVFIRNDWENEFKQQIPEVLKKLTTHKIARRFRAKTDNTEILYTHEKINGKKKAINLEEYPNTKEYLYNNYERLASRSYIKKSGRNWFEIWVPQDPSIWEKNKIVFRDIAEEPTFWLDDSGSVVNGDCYFFYSSNEDYMWLALAIGNSEFIKDFYDKKFNNKLYSSRRRFVAQYVKEFPLPNPDGNIAKRIIERVKKITALKEPLENQSLLSELNNDVWEVFGLSKTEEGKLN